MQVLLNDDHIVPAKLNLIAICYIYKHRCVCRAPTNRSGYFSQIQYSKSDIGPTNGSSERSGVARITCPIHRNKWRDVRGIRTVTQIYTA